MGLGDDTRTRHGYGDARGVLGVGGEGIAFDSGFVGVDFREWRERGTGGFRKLSCSVSVNPFISSIVL